MKTIQHYVEWVSIAYECVSRYCNNVKICKGKYSVIWFKIYITRCGSLCKCQVNFSNLIFPAYQHSNNPILTQLFNICVFSVPKFILTVKGIILFVASRFSEFLIVKFLRSIIFYKYPKSTLSKLCQIVNYWRSFRLLKVLLEKIWLSSQEIKRRRSDPVL